jgi:hypothetical protein
VSPKGRGALSTLADSELSPRLQGNVYRTRIVARQCGRQYYFFRRCDSARKAEVWPLPSVQCDLGTSLCTPRGKFSGYFPVYTTRKILGSKNRLIKPPLCLCRLLFIGGVLLDEIPLIGVLQRNRPLPGHTYFFVKIAPSGAPPIRNFHAGTNLQKLLCDDCGRSYAPTLLYPPAPTAPPPIATVKLK